MTWGWFRSYIGGQAVNKTPYEMAFERGKRQEAQIIIELILTKRFGPVSVETRKYLDTLSVDDLEKLIHPICDARSFEELGLPK